jgi:hypothetical protein
MTVDRCITDEVLTARREKLRGRLVVDELDTHRGLLRLKVAALLARLECRLNVSAQDWMLAEIVMDTSDQVRDWVRGVVADDKARRQSAGNVANAERQAVAKARTHSVDSRIANAVRYAVRHVKKHSVETGESCPWRCVQQAIGGRYSKEEKEAARESALAGGLIEEVDEESGPARFAPPGGRQ